MRGFSVGRPLLWVVLGALLFLLVLPAAPVRASDDFLPDSPEAMADWTQPPLYDRYSVWNYTYGGVKTFPETIGRLYYLINLMQVGKAWVVKLGIRTVEYALYFDAVSPVIGAVGRSMSAISNLTAGSPAGWLVRAGLALAGAVALWHWTVGGRRNKAFQVLAGTAVLLVGTYIIVAKAPAFLIASSGAARGLGGEIVSGVAAVAAPAAGQGAPSERLVRAAGEGVWEALVFDPWVEGEFSAGAAAKAAYLDGNIQGGRWLKMTPTERENWYLSRMDFATRLADFHQYEERLVQDYLPRRFFLALVSLLLGLVWTLAMLLLAGGVLYYQFVLLGMLALAPLWAVLGLWHPSGLRVARGALVKAAGALISQVVLLAVLALALGLTGPLLSLGAPLGWLTQGLLVTLCVAALCRYRFAWLRWGRESGSPGLVREIATWRERFRSRRTVAAGATGREVVQDAALVVSQVLPQFREVAAAAAGGPSLRVEDQEPGGRERPAPAPGVDLSDELRRLRLRLVRTGGEGREAPAGRPEPLPRPAREAVGESAQGVATARSSAPAGAPGPGPRPRAEVGQALNEYRRR
jgi:hypothetical protein